LPRAALSPARAFRPAINSLLIQIAIDAFARASVSAALLDIGGRSLHLCGAGGFDVAQEKAMSRNIGRMIFAATIFALGVPSAAMAQGVHQYSFPGSSSPSSYGTSTGGTVHSGTAVPTGRISPLNQPIPPAASSYYSRQLGRAGTPTYPSPYPFGAQ
jgi:hypothetical protein